MSDSEKNHFEGVLKNILVPRVVGTALHTKVKEYLKSEFKSLGWTVSSDVFTAKTPVFGDIIFENIIARLNPGASEVVVFSCHYDSKFFRDFEFVGAIDAAVPCAMLVHLAHSLHNRLEPLRKMELSIEIWFFDGEESFEKWGPTDSLYGARHLAAKLENENLLSNIKCLILLDLLGTKNPVIYNYHSEKEIFHHLVAAESSLRQQNFLKEQNFIKTYFRNKVVLYHVEDDHTPFMEKGVPIVHIIPASFPDVWHTSADNLDAVDMDTVADLNKILHLFVLKYFNI